MRAKLQTKEGRTAYARRKAITEPVHGQIKQARGFRQFLLRGARKVSGEFTLVAIAEAMASSSCSPSPIEADTWE